ncbi:hypothetical protein BGP_1066 [Beggiatoa sp. PS]|nr:hypothetical protein BGP_1066 [Beggiatoa sp. PS]
MAELSLSDNQLTGSIPEFSALTNLTYLNLSGNTGLCKNPNADYAGRSEVNAFPICESDNDNDGLSDSVDPDDDNDTVLDTEDAFPFDANESVDTDGDGTGNNADTDDDNDGLSDEYEARYEFLDPLNAADATADEDGDGVSNLEEYQQAPIQNSQNRQLTKPRSPRSPSYQNPVNSSSP